MNQKIECFHEDGKLGKGSYESTKYAIVRPPPNTYASCTSRHPSRYTISVKKAKKQHRRFCEAIEQLGIKLIRLDPDDRYPDSCFVEDCAIVVGDTAAICRFGLMSRRGEESEIEKVLSHYKRVKKMSGPGTVEGGDFLCVETDIFVGLSQRTNTDGVNVLRKYLRKPLTNLEVKNLVHLKTACSYLGRNVVLVAQNLLDPTPFSKHRVIEVPQEESYAANCLALGNYVLVPRGYKRTIDRIRRAQFDVIEVEASEFEKGDGGITCLALVFELGKG